MVSLMFSSQQDFRVVEIDPFSLPGPSLDEKTEFQSLTLTTMEVVSKTSFRCKAPAASRWIFTERLKAASQRRGPEMTADEAWKREKTSRKDTRNNLPKVSGIFALHFLQRGTSNIPPPKPCSLFRGIGNLS